MDLTIDPEAIDANDLEETAQTIADLVLAAVRDAYRRAGDLQQEKIGPFADALGGPVCGMPVWAWAGRGQLGGLDLGSGTARPVRRPDSEHGTVGLAARSRNQG